MSIYDDYDGCNKPMIAAIIITILWIVVVSVGIFGFVNLNREAKLRGDGYLSLAKQSSSIEMSLGYLYKYKEAIEINGLTKGTAGLYFKTVDNGMEFRYQRLVEGIKFLEDFSSKFQKDDRINTIDFSTLNQMVVSSGDSEGQSLSSYIDSLDMGISQYLSANYIGWRFFDVMSLVVLIFGIAGLVVDIVLWITVWCES